jgi:hypothetical protein
MTGWTKEADKEAVNASTKVNCAHKKTAMLAPCVCVCVCVCACVCLPVCACMLWMAFYLVDVRACACVRVRACERESEKLPSRPLIYEKSEL